FPKRHTRVTPPAVREPDRQLFALWPQSHTRSKGCRNTWSGTAAFPRSRRDRVASWRCYPGKWFRHPPSRCIVETAVRTAILVFAEIGVLSIVVILSRLHA